MIRRTLPMLSFHIMRYDPASGVNDGTGVKFNRQGCLVGGGAACDLANVEYFVLEAPPGHDAPVHATHHDLPPVTFVKHDRMTFWARGGSTWWDFQPKRMALGQGPRFELRAGEAVYVGDYRIDWGAKPPKVAISRNDDAATQALRAYPLVKRDLTFRSSAPPRS